jgi:glycosyltransferase involved in cell wall biosynthesis
MRSRSHGGNHSGTDDSELYLMRAAVTPMKTRLKADLGISGLAVMYIGNLEPYQGIDLLLDSFTIVVQKAASVSLIIIGGQSSDIQRYQKLACHHGIENKVHFLGPKPLEGLARYLAEADILVSPRIKGKNTPLKLYSYLDSGKPVVATDLPTHTQVLHSRVAMLSAPLPQEFSEAIIRLIQDESLRIELGRAGRKLVEERFTYDVFREKLNCLFDWLKMESEKLDDDASRTERASGKFINSPHRGAFFGWKPSLKISEKRSKKFE